ncbi:MAG: DUF1559 domain-containing protein [Verrucomicrobiae bacterium]|nr:DUF1559 domain-containing protein [Verrucomicrobiae bacterium]
MGTKNIGVMKMAFTLTELLVVLVILSVLAALLSPALKKARESARSIQCVNNLRQMGLGLESYLQAYDGWFPDYLGSDSWVAVLAPYVGGPMISGGIAKLFCACPSFNDSNWPPINSGGVTYGYNYWFLGRHDYGTFRNISQIDQPSQIIAFADSDGDGLSSPPGASKYRVLKPPSTVARFSIRHSNGGNVLFVDGHVEWHGYSDSVFHTSEHWGY